MNAAQQEAVDRYFGGDEALFGEFLQACKAQFPIDLSNGHTACQHADWPALRRIAHDFKSLLLSLGYPTLSQQAAECETFCAQGNAASAQSSWGAMQADMAQAFDL